MAPYDPVARYGSDWRQFSDGSTRRVVIHKGRYCFEERGRRNHVHIPNAITPPKDPSPGQRLGRFHEALHHKPVSTSHHIASPEAIAYPNGPVLQAALGYISTDETQPKAKPSVNRSPVDARGDAENVLKDPESILSGLSKANRWKPPTPQYRHDSPDYNRHIGSRQPAVQETLHGSTGDNYAATNFEERDYDTQPPSLKQGRGTLPLLPLFQKKRQKPETEKSKLPDIALKEHEIKEGEVTMNLRGEKTAQVTKGEKSRPERETEAREQTRQKREEQREASLGLREAIEGRELERMHQELLRQKSAAPVVLDALALHSDSGYASNDATRMHPEVKPYLDESILGADDELPKASYPAGSNHESPLPLSLDYEIASVLSDTDDNRSMGASPKSRPILEAESQIRALFALNEDLQSLAKDLLAKMGRERFVDNLRRLLMSYYKSQKQVASSNLEHAVVALLGSRTLREGIATHVADELSPMSEQMRLDHDKDMDRILDTRASVEAWLSNNLAFALPPDVVEENDSKDANLQHDDSSDSEDEHEAEEPQVEFAHIARAASFLCAGPTFQDLLLDMQVLLIPSEFRILAQTLLTIPKEDVRIDRVYETNSENKCKTFVNRMTNVDWNWWPLTPVIPPLPEDRVRIWWKCHCEDKLWEDIPKNQRHLFEKLLSVRKSSIRWNHLCQTAFKRRGGALATRSPTSGGSSTTTNPHASTPAANTYQMQPGLSISSEPSSSTASSSLSRSVSPALSTDATSVDSTTVTIPGSHRFVLLGIGGIRSTLELENVDVINDFKSDKQFFGQLKILYRSARGLLRIWFSIWRLSHCDFVKFRKFRPLRVTELCKDLPVDKSEYTYSPRPPEVTVLAPGITKHMWHHALYPCEKRSMGLKIRHCIFEWFHDCIDAFNEDSKEYIARMPKKHSNWLINTEGIEDAFGILTREEPSLLYVLLYHVLIVAGPFAFWIWRQSRKGGSWDLQDPSVPFAIVVGLLSLFWASARPLGLFREPQV